jgi:hypothetical protein
VAGEAPQRRAGIDVPDLNLTRLGGLVRHPGGRRQLWPAGVKGNGQDFAVVPRELPKHPAVGGIPQPHDPIETAGSETPAVGTEGQRRHRRRMTGESQPATTLAHVPE